MSNGRRISGDFLTLYCMCREEGEEWKRPRLGMTISKRILRRMHDRAKLKRILREIFRKKKAELKGNSGLIFRLARQPKSLLYKDIETECLTLLNRGGLL